MLKVSNQKPLRRLTRQKQKHNPLRVSMTILAIVLTSVMFMTLFTVFSTVINSFEEQTFKRVGGNFHGTFKSVTADTMGKLSNDPLIKSYGQRLLIGIVNDERVKKMAIEIGYKDTIEAQSTYSMPTTGHLPEEGTHQIACDTTLLKKLGVTPEIGQSFSLTYNMYDRTAGYLDTTTPHTLTDTFELSGYWDASDVTPAHQVIVSKDYTINQLTTYTNMKTPQDLRWDLNVFFNNDHNINNKMLKVLENHGYQPEDRGLDNYVSMGVNWGYMDTQLFQNLDFSMVLTIVVLLAIMILTGYLMIYNIFQIAVITDIQFFGLLKTIGMTQKQIKRMVYQDALRLSLFGIPIGLIIGSLIGTVIAPIVLSTTSYQGHAVSGLNLYTIAFTTIFALLTVFISTRKPAKKAAGITPLEALNYNQETDKKKNSRRGKSKAKKHQQEKVSPPSTNRGHHGMLFLMAKNHLLRHKKRSVIVVLSLTLSIVLFQFIINFTSGFDEESYLENSTVADYQIGSMYYFQVGNTFNNLFTLSDSDFQAITEGLQGVTNICKVYGQTIPTYESTTPDIVKAKYTYYDNDVENANAIVETLEKDPNHEGQVFDNMQLYGMDQNALNKIKLLDGDLSPLNDPNAHAIAIIASLDDYGKPVEGTPWSPWVKIGDEVTVRYTHKTIYKELDTGKLKENPETISGGYELVSQDYQDVTYKVVALVGVDHNMTYRYYGSHAYILGADQFIGDSKTDNLLYALVDTDDTADNANETFLKDYTTKVNDDLDYESKQSILDEFKKFESMFVLIGGLLTFIIGLIGVLNFINVMITSIITRKQELAMLEAVGLTKSQMKKSLIYEGLLMTLSSGVMSLIITLVTIPLFKGSFGQLLWFYKFHLTLTPLAMMIPTFAVLGFLIPLILTKVMLGQSVVERLRRS